MFKSIRDLMVEMEIMTLIRKNGIVIYIYIYIMGISSAITKFTIEMDISFPIRELLTALGV